MPLETAQQRLCLAEAIIFGILLLPTIYTIPKHGKPGMVVYPILASTCILALIHGVLHVAQHEPSGFGVILTSTGVLTTLLLVPIGVVCEVMSYLPNTRKRSILPNLVILHLLTTGLITTAVIGTTGLHQLPNGSRDSKPTLQRVGYIGLMVVLLTVLFELLYLLFGPIKASLKLTPSPRFRQLQKLLYFTIASIPFTAIRLVHQIAYAFDMNVTLDPERGSFATIFLAVFIMQLGATTILVVGSIVSRNLRMLEEDEVTLERIGSAALKFGEGHEGPVLREHRQAYL